MRWTKRENEESRFFQPVLLVVSIIAFAILSGCVSQQPEVLKINPVIDYNPLEGFTGKSEGMFTVIKGSIPEVKESLKDIVIKKAAQTSTFSVDDDLNFVVFRGVFSTGGYGINIDRVEKQGNIFTVYATYRDPGKGIGVTEAFTQPTAIIPIGKLAEGDYEARLRVTRVLDTFEGRRVIEPEKELSIFNFKVKPTASNIGISHENVSSTYLAGQVFDEPAGNFTKNWDSGNFAGFWRDSETNVSTETLVIDQNILNNSHRVIEKHNLIYTTKSMPVKYQVYMHANQTPAGTDGFYPVAGWMGDKYVFLEGNRLAKIIFEQNVTDVKSIRVGESWNLEGGYRIVANSIDADGIMQAWISLDKDNTKIDDKVLATRYTELYSYPQNAEGSNIPILVTYLSKIYSLPETDAADFKYAWLRSQNFTDIKEGDTFGVMEVTSVKNDTIELRNKEPIELTSGNTIRLMENIGIQVNSSKTGLLFYPVKGRNLNV